MDYPARGDFPDAVARVRLHRLNNLRAWHVEDIINTIPVLLQLALAMFLAGLLILLWNYNDTVAAVASALVCVLSAFTMATTVLPLFHHSCSYLAPHTRTLHSLWKSIAKKTKAATRYLRDIAQSPRNVQVTTLPGSKADGEQTWQGREQSAIEQKQVNWDTQTLVEAYKITLHPDSLSAATVCLMDLDAREVIDYFQQLHTSAREHLGVVADSKYGLCGDGRQQQLLWLLVILCVLQGDFSLTCDEAASLDVYFQSGHWPTSMQAADAEWAVSTLDALTDHLARAGNRTMKLINQEILCAERQYLIHKFAGREIPLASIIFIDVTREYREVRLREMFLSEASLDEAKTAHTGYLSSVDHFLECADRALAPSHSINGLEIVRTYVRDVVAELTRTLLRIFAEDGVQSTITAETLWDVIHRLANIVSDSMLQCIPDDLRSDVLRMANILAEPRDYGNFWGSDIPGFARKLVSRIIDIKGKPDHDLTKRSPACATVETSNAAQISSKAAAACASSAASGRGEDSREQKASPLTEAPS
ncbi:hypothetical protein C2E23DRAFT_430162 [Lenzites betulinus]|nr:hypothetical protein C2E23DRAFT_430162 [Lenzites betulinus]